MYRAHPSIHPRNLLLLLLLGTSLLLIQLTLTGCSENDATNPTNKLDRLAGGGRGDSNDPFIGGPGDSGPNDSLPGVPGFPGQGIYPIYVTQFASWEQPKYQFIETRDDWVAWWDTAMSYFERFPKPTIPIPGDSTNPDSSWPGPDSNWVPPMPEIDFSTNLVVVIRLEPGSWGRYFYIAQIETGVSGSTIHYEVLTPGDDCPVPEAPAVLTIPVGAFVVPRPLPEPREFEMVETTYDCSWEPDPNEPYALYFSDAECPEIGDGEKVIRSADEWKSWTDQAWTCDMERWGGYNDTSLIIWIDTIRTDPPDMSWLVDFSTHAVIILRSAENVRWGGGIWLNRFEVTGSGTSIEYTDVQPEGSCPPTEDGSSVRPTVAIRVPLPLTEPITWIRNVETVSCDWGDSTKIGP